MRLHLLLPLCLLIASLSAQSLPDDCKLLLGTNLGGLADYGTELPFVDLMHNCRNWYTKDVGNPNGSPFDTQQAGKLSYRPDGYPTHLPQTINSMTYPQTVATIWAITDGWPTGKYTVLFDGKGQLGFWGGLSNLQQTASNRLTFDFLQPIGSILEMTIRESDAADPVRNIRVLMPGSESTYLTQPFNPVWVEKLRDFPAVRFMDWFHTNNWAQNQPWEWNDPRRFEWAERQQPNHYTWADPKGIPYEMAVRLMNDLDLDGWVCVPHQASDDYIRQMARLFHDQLEPQRKLTVEYSNETWNWIFGQAQWLNQYGCINQNLPWPEGTVPYMQRCFDLWTEVYGPDIDRLTRVVGVQTGWQDVSNRTVFNLRPGSFDAFGCTYYFGLNDAADQALDALGTAATASDVAHWARVSREDTKTWLNSQREQISLPLQLPMIFYEGGQHLTPNPFGQEPTYAQALLDIQRDTAMYHLYQEWYDYLRSFQTGSEPLTLMNFSFVSNRSARYGSWGLLETMQQDLSQIPAPKYQSTLEQIARYRQGGCATSSTSSGEKTAPTATLLPNPTSGTFALHTEQAWSLLQLYDLWGRPVRSYSPGQPLQASGLPAGLYVVRVIWANAHTADTTLLLRVE